ncbi:MAG: DUF1048 domain-containing protein [Bifidobacteriaceae bacterium]|jgi:DNA-binding ferritin-like protein (Dps family)|nr:DUF1048 domain-containing protein [Bifidobacteriaceae bacterium]
MNTHESHLNRLFREKREWRAYVRRRKALPPDYRLVLTHIEKYLFNFAADSSILGVFYDMVELFEEGAAAGRPVIEVTGDDVAAFAWDALAAFQAATWTGGKAEALNKAVRAALAKGNEDGKR